MQKLPRLLHFLVNLAGLNLLIFILFRLVFWGYFKNSADPIPTPDLLHSFYLGLKFDLRLTLLMLLPLFLLGGFRWLSPFESNLMRRVWFLYLASAFGIVLLFYFMNFGYYAYLHTPMNATVLRFAYDLSTSAQMMWETYPMVWVFVGFSVMIIAYLWFLHRILWNADHFANPQFRGWVKAVMVSLSTVLVIAGLYGKFSYYPLRWSEAFAQAHTFAPSVALNPVLYFTNTLKNKDVSFNEAATRDAYPNMAAYLGVDHPNADKLDFTRQLKQTSTLPPQRPNIVMVFLESFASYKTGLFGNPLNPTPNFDHLARNGLSFSRYYTPHTGTARSVFAAVTGIPDVELHKTASRNPLVVEQHTIINAFRDYHKMYFLGGSASWGNIRGVLQRNIPGLEIHEEGSYQAERVDVWGISDLSLFEEANKVFQKQQQPFFAIIQTSGNHRPYTIPEYNRGFQPQHHDSSTYQQAGFISEAEYNSFHFMDHAIGLFMQDARKQDYFRNTLFVFFGDHGITGYAGRHTPEFESKFLLSGFHTPLVFYAPDLLPKLFKGGQTIDKIASEVDLLPTIAGLTTPGYTNTTLGRDLLDTRLDSPHYAFTITHHSVPEIGLISRDHYFRMQADGNNKLLANTASSTPLANVVNKETAIAKDMETITRQMFETARYMLYHNKTNVQPKTTQTTPTP